MIVEIPLPERERGNETQIEIFSKPEIADDAEIESRDRLRLDCVNRIACLQVSCAVNYKVGRVESKCESKMYWLVIVLRKISRLAIQLSKTKKRNTEDE